ncbi:MAG TPA: rhodanese-like domain-containing protein [Stellaceae bacterium]|jgi:rhodanese-related sulfurtransferase|nr:rhodanese-like domain-containing protein [Stellaceae bacterium]
MSASQANSIDVATLRQWLGDGAEIALVDVREEGQHGAGHPLLAVNVPYSKFELTIGALVPRRSCRVVLLDDGDGLAGKAARRLATFGYGAVHILEGGVSAWAAAGYPLFPSTNVPSKAFAELVEHDYHTPAITAAELNRRRAAGENIVVLDSRPLDEYERFHVPGAITCPGAELVLHFADLVPDPDAVVVVSCAGRTRGIIGAQSLRTAGVPNQIMSLEGGTQAWRLAGLDLERGMTTALHPASREAIAAARQRSDAVARRYGVRTIDAATLASWQGDAEHRTTYVLDVRTPSEYAAGHLPGSLSAPGGQLVQAIDRWVGTRNSRIVLVDDVMARAVMTAQWLLQMGWDVVVLDRPFTGAALATGDAPDPEMPDLPSLALLDPHAAAARLTEGAAAVSLDSSADYRTGHPAGAVWSMRSRLDRLPAEVLQAPEILLFAENAPAAQLAAIDLHELSSARLAIVRGGGPAWREAGLPVVASPDQPSDRERIDYLFWNHDRHAGNQDAMRAYLRWETELPGEIARDGLAGFRVGVPAGAR